MTLFLDLTELWPKFSCRRLVIDDDRGLMLDSFITKETALSCREIWVIKHRNMKRRHVVVKKNPKTLIYANASFFVRPNGWRKDPIGKKTNYNINKK